MEDLGLSRTVTTKTLALRACLCAPLSALLITNPLNAEARAPSAELSEALSPPKSSWISYRAARASTAPTVMTPELIKDPKQLLAYIQSKPNALNVAEMPDVSLALEVAQLLLFNGEPAKGLKVLIEARARWPEDPNLTFAWSRAMISLGTPSYGKAPLEALLAGRQHEMPYHNYARYLLALSIFLEGEDQPIELGKTLQLLEEILRRDPSYVGPDGMTAQKLRDFTADLKEKIAGMSPPSELVH